MAANQGPPGLKDGERCTVIGGTHNACAQRRAVTFQLAEASTP